MAQSTAKSVSKISASDALAEHSATRCVKCRFLTEPSQTFYRTFRSIFQRLSVFWRVFLDGNIAHGRGTSAPFYLKVLLVQRLYIIWELMFSSIPSQHQISSHILFAGTLFDPSLCPSACSICKLILRHVSRAQTIDRSEHKIILFRFMHPNPVLDMMQRIRTWGANRPKNLFMSANSKNVT